jgi:hypothetical protein
LSARPGGFSGWFGVASKGRHAGERQSRLGTNAARGAEPVAVGLAFLGNIQRDGVSWNDFFYDCRGLPVRLSVSRSISRLSLGLSLVYLLLSALLSLYYQVPGEPGRRACGDMKGQQARASIS